MFGCMSYVLTYIMLYVQFAVEYQHTVVYALSNLFIHMMKDFITDYHCVYR